MIGLAGSNWLSAQQAGRTPWCRSRPLEIEQLVKGYTHGVDVGPEDASWVYTSDGEFLPTNTSGSRRREALKEMYSRLRKSTRPGP